MIRAFVLSSLMLSLFCVSPVLGSDNLSGILEGIRNKHNHLPGLTVNYTREVITRSMSMLGNQVKGDIATGRIYFRPPYFLRLEQETPQAETIIANGETLWWYIPEKKRAHQYPFLEFGKELKLLSDIFRGLVRVEENFQIAMLMQEEQGAYGIELRPDPPWQEIDRIILTVTVGYDIRQVDIHNQLGSITRFKLEGLTAKEKFDENFFHFTFPEGVKLVKEGG
ncbi:MAG: outer membrane lipoprotein carrier protein LolA [Deltaproteobacteria bacterium]|nr:outer membrane lipoprotein carrier protein LolA [Deltaproteobacteria bacterium]MBW2117424.1 outer membrane lipoprotein carrier protein LolA [Deltaproteobacteria bacterium]MBW2345201.1 outer membrane lipoprotein carrier protein LolA [Deltaproteobacteria bacterium]